MRIFLALIFLASAPCMGAEFLIYVHEVSQTDPTFIPMTKGDIVVVRPDGWQWGRNECLPDFIVVKVPGLAVDISRDAMELLSDNVTERERSYAILSSYIDAAVYSNTSVFTIQKNKILNYIKKKL